MPVWSDLQRGSARDLLASSQEPSAASARPSKSSAPGCASGASIVRTACARDVTAQRELEDGAVVLVRHHQQLSVAHQQPRRLGDRARLPRVGQARARARIQPRDAGGNVRVPPPPPPPRRGSACSCCTPRTATPRTSASRCRDYIARSKTRSAVERAHTAVPAHLTRIHFEADRPRACCGWVTGRRAR